jgi:hypothetical protein
MKNALQTGEPIDVEYRVMSIDGDWRWMRSRGLPRFAPSGEIIRWYGSVEDIHDQKLQEQTSLRESRAEGLSDSETLAKGHTVHESLQNSIEKSGLAEGTS